MWDNYLFAAVVGVVGVWWSFGHPVGKGGAF